MESFVKGGLSTLDEYLKERQLCVDKLREVETQLRGCKVLAEETKERIYAGDQYVNYSHITLKAGGPRAGLNKSGKGYGVDLEARINKAVLAIPECGECKFCIDPNTRKMCAKRREVRRDLIEEEMIHVPVQQPIDANTKVAKSASSTYKPVKERKKPGRKKGWNLAVEASPGYKKPKGSSKGSVPMSLPDRLLPEFCSLISANGTNQRMGVINGFCLRHPETSARQATIKFTELTTKDKPSCVPNPPKKIGKGRSIRFYVRPRYYKIMQDDERPDGWEEAAEADELLWQEEQEAEAKAKSQSDQKIRAMMTDKSGESDDGDTHNSMSASVLTSMTGNDSDEESDRPMKKTKVS